MRLIDANHVANKIHKKFKYAKNDIEAGAFLAALYIIDCAPTIEAEPTSFGCSSCKHRTNCKNREKCGRENGSGYEPCKPSPSKEEKLARLTKFSEIIEHYGSGAQLGKLMLASAHLLVGACKCHECGIEISNELNEHAAEVVVLIMQIYTHAPLYWVAELEKAIDEIIEREIKKIEVENEKNT